MIRRLLLLMVVKVGMLNASAQDPAFFRLSSEQGLPSNEVYTIHQDKRGFIWLGSDAGLFRFDGFRFQRYKSSRQKSRALSGLAESSDGSIYAFSFAGQIFRTSGDSLIELPNWSLPLNGISIGFLKNEGEVLWVTALDGVYAYSIAKDEWIYFDDFANTLSNDDNRVVVSGFYQSNNYYFLNAKGIGIIDPAGATSVVTINDFNGHGTYFLTKKDETYWVFAMDGTHVLKSNNGKIDPFYSESLNASLKGRKLTFVGWIDNELYIGTHSGLIIFNDSTQTVRECFHSTPISRILKDREGVYWLTSLSEGIFRIPSFENEVWRIQTKSGRTIPITKIDGNQEYIYCSTGQGQIGVFNKSKREWREIPIPIQADPQTVFIDYDNRVYLSIMNTIYELKGEQFIPVVRTVSSCKSIFRTTNGYLFASSIGVFFLPEISGRYPLQTLSNSWSREFQHHHSIPGAYLAATNNGVLEILPQSDSFVTRNFCLEGQQVLSIQTDTSTHSLFSLTASGLLVMYDRQGEHVIKKFEETDIPYKIRLQDSGIVVATAQGLITIRFADWKSQRITRRDGLVADEINALVVDVSGYWLATARGLQFVPSTTKGTISESSLYLKGLSIDDRHHDPFAFLYLDFGQSLTFFPEFSCYRFADVAEYAYRILPHDTTWRRIPGNSESITIPSLRSGKFTVELGLFYEGEMLIAKPLSINGYVLAPFWQRWWFYVLVVLFGSVIAFFGFKIRLGYIKRKQERELERLRMETELKLSQQTALKSQMNPHFLFNVLNSIKGFIYENDRKNATSFLNDFSNLVRKILELSSRQVVTLSEELDVLKPYIRLESMMIGDDFSYTISIDSSVDPEHVFIPPLIIQPFVENCFKHGLRHKQGVKKLVIRIHAENGQLVIAISDNGVGRKRADELKEGSEKHRSFGSHASQRRIALFADHETEKAGIEIQDNEDENGNPSGTTLIMRMPLQTC